MNTLAPSFLIRSSSFFVGNKDIHESLDEFINQMPPLTPELSALERLKN